MRTLSRPPPPVSPAVADFDDLLGAKNPKSRIALLSDSDIFVGHVSEVTLSFAWALRDSERSGRVKIADRSFASRQSASLVSIERG
jgi:hypothetical protein